MKKNAIIKSLIIAGISLGGLVFSQNDVFAHGYVKSPVSRGYMGSLEKNTIGWSAAFAKYGNVISNPQSLEYTKGFPVGGPSDGRIASAEAGMGQIGDYVLDEQNTTRWTKNNIKGGENTFTWEYTAPHSTSKWHYYITKKGWDPNQPLKRSDFELIGEVEHDGSSAKNNLSHKINVPTDRNGYNVILAVWDVADTDNAFYNVIDVNLQNDIRYTAK